jgi:hypothetical protein
MKRTLRHAFRMIVAIAALAAGIRQQSAATPAPIPCHDPELRVDVWTDRGDGAVYNAGENLYVYFYASDDCYLTVYDIDTEGRVRILFPQYPDEGFVYGGTTYRIPDYYDHSALRAAGPRGVEYIHAVATREPRLFRRAVRDHRYDTGFDPVTDDPFVAINAINAQLISPYYIHATATTSFFIEGRVWYPRYMCSGCHHPARVRSFDPYRSACRKYTVIVAHDYDYWWAYDYHPSITRFVFSGPFWRFDFRSGPAWRHPHSTHLDCAYGYSNYRPVHPPSRSYQGIERKSPRDTERRTRERSYTTVRFDEARSRTDYGTIRTRDAERTSRDEVRTRDADGTIRSDTRERSTDTAPTPNTRTRDADGTIRSDTRERSTDTAPTPNTRTRDADGTIRSDTRERSTDTAPTPNTRIRSEGTRTENTPVTSDRVSTRSDDASVVRERVRTEQPSSSGSTGRARTDPSRDGAVNRERTATTPRPDLEKQRQAVEPSRDREPRETDQRSANRESSQRQENINASPRDRSSRAPDQRSR